MSHNQIAKGTEAVAPTLAPLLGQLFVAIGGAITAWVTLSTRFLRVQRFETETAGSEASFRRVYMWAQYANAALFIGLIVIAIIAVIGGLMTSTLPDFQIAGAETGFGRLAVFFFRLGWWVVLLGIAVGGIAVLDVFARVGLGVTRLLAWLPIPGFEGRYGPDGRSVGWIQAREFVRAAAAAQPLAINSIGIDGVIDAVVVKLAAEIGGAHRAPTPFGSPAGKGNIALFACLIEQLETDAEAPRRRWDKFYEAFSQLNQAKNFFEPAGMLTQASGAAFHAALRAEIDPLLTAEQQAVLPNGQTAREAVERTFKRLTDKFAGDVTMLAERKLIAFHSKAYGLMQRARGFPKLDDDRMRPQFVKLCLRWGVVPISHGDKFVPAFSATIAWYLLETNALEALVDQKSVAFRGSPNRPSARMGEMRVIDKIADRLLSVPDDAPALRDALAAVPTNEERWYTEQEIDTALWGLSKEMFDAAKAAAWANNNWSLDKLIATRA